MAYYLDKERSKDIVGSYQRYQEYLRAHQHRLPPGAFALGTAEWWQNPNDYRGPHDGWLESCTVIEATASEGGERLIAIRTRLLNRRHGGHIELFYPRVYSYSLHGMSSSGGLGDWRYDEFTLSPAGNMTHEIEWAGLPRGEGSRWIIEASDIEYRLIPK